MSRWQVVALVVALAAVAACTSIPSVAPTSPIATETVGLATPGATPEPTPRHWRVDVVNNGPRRVIVDIITTRNFQAGWAVEPNARVTLFELPNATTGRVELFTDGCLPLDDAAFDALDFTVILSGTQTGPYSMTLQPGVAVAVAPQASVGGCFVRF